GRGLDVRVGGEGSIRRLAGSVRVTARVVSVADGFQLWAQRLDVPEGELVAATEKVARSVAEALAAGVAPGRYAPRARFDAQQYVRARHAVRRSWRGCGQRAP